MKFFNLIIALLSCILIISCTSFAWQCDFNALKHRVQKLLLPRYHAVTKHEEEHVHDACHKLGVDTAHISVNRSYENGIIVKGKRVFLPVVSTPQEEKYNAYLVAMHLKNNIDTPPLNSNQEQDITKKISAGAIGGMLLSHVPKISSLVSRGLQSCALTAVSFLGFICYRRFQYNCVHDSIHESAVKNLCESGEEHLIHALIAQNNNPVISKNVVRAYSRTYPTEYDIYVTHTLAHRLTQSWFSSKDE